MNTMIDPTQPATPSPARFIRWLPTAGVDAAVAVKPMTFEHVRFWHAHVQPMIDRRYKKAGAAPTPADIRADVGWDWTLYFAYLQLYNVSTNLPLSDSGPGLGLAVVVEADDGTDVPVGLLTVVPRFGTDVLGQRRPRTFAWFLADAPAELYTALALQPLKLVGRALLDSAIQSGFRAGMDGELLLHADPGGGPRLLEFYRDTCKMTPVPLQQKRISPLRRPAERYFHFSAPQAGGFAQQFDRYR